MENKVDFKTFSWAIGLMTIVIGWILINQTNTNKRIDVVESNFSEGFSEIKVDIGSIKTDISWIKDSMNKQNNITFK